LTLEDVDALAKDDALQVVKELLYDTSDKTHLWDAMRIAAPFGAAWAEVMGTWARLLVNNPRVLDRLAHGMYGLQQQGSNAIYQALGVQHDPEQGFFFKDMTTGDESFAWPMPAQANAFLTGGLGGGDPGIMAAAPVSGLNLIGQVQPGFGPVVTSTAGLLLNHPGWREDVLNFIAPFGGPSMQDAGGLGNAVIDSVTPAWVRKLMVAVFPVNAEQKSQLAAAQQTAMIYLASTGDYKLGGAGVSAVLARSEQARLVANAETMARRLYFLRGIAQFALPTLGAPEMSAVTGNGELVLQVKLAGLLGQYQADPAEGGYGYQQGFLRFLRDYGKELYFMGVDGSDSTGYGAPTKKTYEWMRNNNDLVTTYDGVWGLLVPDPGTEFYYPAYQAQIRRGFRTMVNPDKIPELANARLGRALYTSYRDQYGDSPTEAEAAELRSLQSRLEIQFPGYSRIPESLGGTGTLILELEAASKDPRVLRSPVGPSLATYFQARAQIRSQGVSDLRTGLGRELAPDLYYLGSQLAANDPAFRAAWDRLLSYEFDSEQFAQEAA
jgi:hypothetical protein